jgi:hypothetical protein
MTAILGSTAKCQKCACHEFAIPREAYLDADITCLECGYICTVQQAIDAGRSESQLNGFGIDGARPPIESRAALDS